MASTLQTNKGSEQLDSLTEFETRETWSIPDPSTAKPMTTEYNQKSLNSFWRRGFASLIGGSRLVNCELERYEKDQKNAETWMLYYTNDNNLQVMTKE